MSIIRVSKPAQYTVIDQRTLDDLSLRWEAKGMLDYLLARPDNWTISPAQLAKYGQAKIDKVRSIINELKAAGYVRMMPLRNDKGQVERREYVVYERPHTEKPVVVKTPQPEKSDVVQELENPVVGLGSVDNSEKPEPENPVVEQQPEKPDVANINDLAPQPEKSDVVPQPVLPELVLPEPENTTLTSTDNYSILNITSINNIFNSRLIGNGSVDNPDEPVYQVPYNGQLWGITYQRLQALIAEYPALDVEEGLEDFAMTVREQGREGRTYGKPFPEAVSWWLDNRIKYKTNYSAGEPSHPALAEKRA